MNNSIKLLYYKFLKNICIGKYKNYCKTQQNILEQELLPEYINYKTNRNTGIVYRSKTNSNEIDILLKFQTLNKIKEMELKQKVKEDKKIRVCFIVTYISKITFESIYRAMEKSDLFEPFIVFYDAQENYFNDFDYEWNEHQNGFQILKDKGYKIYNGFDAHRNFIPLYTFKPDIVFSSDINMDELQNHLSNIYLNTNYLTCYLNYSINTANNYPYHYNNRGVATGWKMFVESRIDYAELMKYSKYCGVNTVLTGYPKLDSYAKPLEDCIIPEKINNENPIVIYAPHFSIALEQEHRNWATFQYYHEYFLSLVKKHPNINFVFKPHPELRHRLHYLQIMTMDEFDKYVEEWNSLQNGLYIFDGEYIDLFRKSDLLIQDSGSFIGEWLPTGKPCMFLINYKRKFKTYLNGFSILGRKILDKYYLCRNQEEIDKYFKMIMFDKYDPMKEERIKLKDELFINIGSAGQKIVEYLTDILTN